MGAYINPPDMTKEQWLAEHGKLLNDAPPRHDVLLGHLPVCLVQNPAFSAAGIAFDERELKAFTAPDSRTKIWFYVQTEKLHEVSPELTRYMEEH